MKASNWNALGIYDRYFAPGSAPGAASGVYSGQPKPVAAQLEGWRLLKEHCFSPPRTLARDQVFKPFFDMKE